MYRMEASMQEVYIKGELHEDDSSLATSCDYHEKCPPSQELPPQIKQETTTNVSPNLETEPLYTVLCITYVDEKSAESIANKCAAADVKLEADSDAEGAEFKPFISESIDIKDEDISDLNIDKMTDKCMLEPNHLEDESAGHTRRCQWRQSCKHAPQNPYNCDVCEFKTVCKPMLKQHLLSHGAVFECDMCDFKAAKEESLDLHLQTHSREMPYECSRCRHKGGSRYDVLKHMHNHLGDHSDLKCHFVWPKANSGRPFHCNKCAHQAKRKVHFEQHWLTHTQYPEKVCNSANSKKLVKSRHPQQLYNCDVCEFKTVWKPLFRQHLLLHSKFFECDMCDFKATKRENLDLHLQTHSREMPYECSRCGHKAVRRHYVLMHMQNHVGDRSNLKCHFVWPTANDENPYQCNKCDYKAKRKEHLERHWLTHMHPEQIYNCNVCEYTTVRKHQLKLHLTAHEEEKPFRCSICGYKTARKGGLTQHLKIHER